MLITTEKLKLIKEFKDYEITDLERKLNAIEKAIRNHTHNNFQVKEIRIKGASSGSVVTGYNPYFKVGDTVEISQSINKGLYVIKAINDTSITLDRELYDTPFNIVTKVFYDDDIIEGAISILKWDLKMANKIGIASETISRHSVSYQNIDKANTIEGRPASLFGFCRPYMKMRR